MKLDFLLCFLLAICCSAQKNSLIEIIDSNGDKVKRQQRIDSLTVYSKQNLAAQDLAEFYHELGSKWYYNNWWEEKEETDIDQALFYTEKSLKLKRQLPVLEEGSLEKTLYNLAYFNSEKGEIYKAIELYSLLVQKYGSSLKQDALFELGLCYSILGDFFKALTYFEDFILLQKAKGSLDSDDRAYLTEGYIRKAETYSRMGHRAYNDEIRLNLEKADSVLQKTPDIDDYYTNLINQLEGNRLLKDNDYFKAVKRYQEVLKDSASLITLDIAIVYNSLGRSQLELKKYPEAFSAFKKGIIKAPGYTDIYRNLGDYFLELEDFDNAMKNYQKAIDLSIAEDRVKSYETIPKTQEMEFVAEKIHLLDYIVSKANAWITYYDYDKNPEHLEKATETFTLADELVDLIRFQNTEEKSKHFWREKSSQLYASAIETCYLLNRPVDAFYFVERNKALLLLEDLSNEEAKQIAKLPDEVAQQEFSLKRAIFLSENSLQEQRANLSQDSLAVLRQRIRNHKYNYEKLMDSLETSYPDYARLKKKVDVLSLERFKVNFISDKQATLQYLLNENDGYGLLTTRDTMALFKIDEVPKLNEEIQDLIAGLSNGVSEVSSLRTASHAVFQKLFPKYVYEQIKGKQITIVPDYKLQQIPFESLVTDNDKLNYLFQEVEIAYAYSFSLLQRSQKTKNDSKLEFLGVAPVAFQKLQLPELYFSEQEINNVTNIFSGETLVDATASKANFIAKADKPSILHLATHADVGDGENPWIAFNDSKMYLKEIYATKINADMVVLSGCNTSSGALKKGEGVMSLARGFFYSGAKSVVSTLWPVSDEAGKDILVSFYKNLDNGLTKSRALQKAKLDYLANTEEEELKHPYYWAGFVVLGDNSPISTKSDLESWIYVVLGFLGIGAAIFGYRKIRTGRRAA